MDKRGFHKMFLIVIALIIAVLILIYVVVTPRTREALHRLSQPETDTAVQTEHISRESQQPSQTETPKTDINADTETVIPQKTLNSLLEELQPHTYSTDPYLEARSILSENAFCFADDADGFSSHMHQAFKKADRLNEYKQLQQHCRGILTAYPTLKSTFENIYLNLKPTSQTGQLLQDSIKRYNESKNEIKSHSEQTLRALLKNQNGPLLAEQAGMPFMYFNPGEPAPISQWIDSRNHRYIEQLFSLSLTRLACQYQGGVACQPSGMAMLLLCTQDPAACGLDFDSYYQQNILPGMQKDVDILVEKFEAMAE